MIIKTLSSLGLLAVALVYSSSASAAPGVSIQQQCQVEYGRYAKAKLVGNTISDWKCVVDGRYYGMSVNEACRNQHGLSQARYRSKNDPYSWYCQ